MAVGRRLRGLPGPWLVIAVMADIDVSGAVTDAANSPDNILVAVANSGDPISDPELPNLWDRFYRVEKSRNRASGGAGIGLAIVKELVESAGGKVGAESEQGRNRFWFTIPAD